MLCACRREHFGANALYLVQEHLLRQTHAIADQQHRRPDFGGLTRRQGNSRGHWEDETLVIETTGFSNQFLPRGSAVPMGPEARVIEKITGPGLWDVSWGGEYPLEISDEPIFQYACQEGNCGLPNTLRGVREEERSGPH